MKNKEEKKNKLKLCLWCGEEIKEGNRRKYHPICIKRKYNFNNKQKIYNNKNKEKINEIKKRYVLRNREKLKSKALEYSKNNIDKLYKKKKEYRKNNKKIVNAENLASKYVKLKDKCEICDSKKNLQRHHWNYNKPLLVNTLCTDCHRIQHTKNFENSVFGRISC